MSEASVTISIGSIHLEALFDPGNGVDAALICHPHPLYGGSMDNNVVSALRKALQEQGWGTLRFNFRGVGGSSGQHRGAQQDAEDLVAVWRHLEERGAKPLHFAGYSYGAWIGLRAMKMGLQVDTAILVSPPLDFLDFKGLAPPPGSCLITAGDQDDFCAVDSLKHWVADTAETPWPARIEILPHCDHFYWGLEDMLAIKIAAFLRRGREA